MMITILVKATVILCAGALVAVTMRRASAASRHLVLMATLVGALIVPVAGALLPVLELRILTPVTVYGPQDASPLPTQTPAHVAATSPAPLRASAADESGREASSAPSVVTSGLVSLILFGLVASGFALLLVRWISGHRTRRALWVHAEPCDSLQVLSAVERVSGLLGIVRDVATRLGGVGTMPLTFGAVAPKLRLPADVTTWPSDRLDAVLMHELAHVRRLDAVAHAATRAVASVYWYHPLAWWLARQARVERERACDDAVLRLGVRPSSYAECLLALCGTAPLSTDAALPMARRAQMAERLRAILDPAQPRTAHSRISVAAAAMILASSAVVGAALLTAPMRVVSPPDVKRSPSPFVGVNEDGSPDIEPAGGAERIKYIERVTSRPPARSTPPAVPRSAEAGSADPQSGPRPIPDRQFGAGASRPGNGVTNPIRIREVKPEYTPAAEREGVQGTIELEAVIGPEGTVTDVRVVRSLDKQFGLDANAMESVRKTPFVPCKVADKPVACLVVFELQYTLPTPQPIPAGAFGAGAYRLTKHPGFVSPVRVRDVKPQYTPEAMRARIEGTVRAELVILADGTVGDIRIIESLDTVYGLDQQAIKSIKAMTFTPAKFNGAAIAVVMPIEQLFTLR